MGRIGTTILNELVALWERGKGERLKKGLKTRMDATILTVNMIISKNLWYQTLNGVFLMARMMSAAQFKSLVKVLRCLNNVAKRKSFMMLAMIIGWQKVEEKEAVDLNAKWRSCKL